VGGVAFASLMRDPVVSVPPGFGSFKCCRALGVGVAGSGLTPGRIGGWLSQLVLLAADRVAMLRSLSGHSSRRWLRAEAFSTTIALKAWRTCLARVGPGLFPLVNAEIHALAVLAAGYNRMPLVAMELRRVVPGAE